jgi:hypothetical protein
MNSIIAIILLFLIRLGIPLLGIIIIVNVYNYFKNKKEKSGK